MAAPHRQRLTQADFNALLSQPAHQDRHLELWNGEIIETMPKPRHGAVVVELLYRLRLFLERHPLGTVLTETQIEIAGQDYAPVPDICVIRNERGPWDPDAALPWMPDLIIEVQSPGQSDQFMRDKADYYLQHGCQLAITVYLKPIVEVRTSSAVSLLVPGDVLDGGDVLPGFSLPASALYPT